jgi:hypothetical protein
MKSVVKIIFVMIILSLGCKKPYSPSIISASNSYLVVEGVINSGTDSTYIKLTRTVKLSSGAAPAPEFSAIVTVEADNGSIYPLTEANNGIYSAPSLNLSVNVKYRLRIKTFNGKEYLSDFVEAKNTPDIDSLNYKVQNDGVEIYVNSHDPNNKTRYYRWDFDETWQYQSRIRSFYKLGADGLPTYRSAYNDTDNIYNCYKTDQSHQVLLGSSIKLAQDVISQQPVDFVAANSGKISLIYSILLRQYALTSDAFNYWQVLKKNTEQLGSIFDAQPSTITGNIHCISDANEPVIGYISVSSVKAKRIILDHYYLNLYTTNPPAKDGDACTKLEIDIQPMSTFKTRLQHVLFTGDSTLVNEVSQMGTGALIGYTYAPTECVNCTKTDPFGTNLAPVYWPYQ